MRKTFVCSLGYLVACLSACLIAVDTTHSRVYVYFYITERRARNVVLLLLLLYTHYTRQTNKQTERNRNNNNSGNKSRRTKKCSTVKYVRLSLCTTITLQYVVTLSFWQWFFLCVFFSSSSSSSSSPILILPFFHFSLVAI